MNLYAAYNIGLATLILPVSFWIAARPTRRADLLLAARVAVLVTLISYPWDFFAIQLGVWRYPRPPGPTVHGVPINDLVFIWLCSFFTSGVLRRLHRRQPSSKRHSKRENAGKERARH